MCSGKGGCVFLEARSRSLESGLNRLRSVLPVYWGPEDFRSRDLVKSTGSGRHKYLATRLTLDTCVKFHTSTLKTCVKNDGRYSSVFLGLACADRRVRLHQTTPLTQGTVLYRTALCCGKTWADHCALMRTLFLVCVKVCLLLDWLLGVGDKFAR